MCIQISGVIQTQVEEIYAEMTAKMYYGNAAMQLCGD